MSEKSNNRGLIYIGHLPHGFYEDQLRGYFNQFGKVTNARVVRSPKTGRSRGYGFVEFEHVDVARIAAETMDNYLMFKRRLVAKFVPEEEKKGLFMRKAWSTTSYPRKYSRAKEKQRQNGVRLAKSTKTLKKRVKRKIEQLKELGVEHSVKAVKDDGVTEKVDQ